MLIHETAVVEEGAALGSRTKVWHHCHIRSGSSIGNDCVLGKNVYVDAGVTIGHRCKIQNNVSVFIGVTVGSDVFVGPSATFTNDLVPRAHNTDWKITETLVGDGVSIGANSTIVCGVSLGINCMVAAGATVTRNVLPNQLVAGTPARHLGWVCRCGAVVSRDINPPECFICSNCS